MMFRKSLLVLGAAAIVAGAAGIALADDYSYKAVIPKLDASPKLDGVVSDDPGWMGAALKGGKLVMDVNHTGDAMTKLPRVCYLGYDKDNLWVSFLVFSSDALVGEAGDGGGVWGEDQVEFFFARSADTEYGHVGMNVNGQRTVERGEEGWDLESVKVAAKREGIVYSIEAQIPFKAIGGAPKSGDKWRINLNGHQVDGDMWIASNPTYGGFHNAERFMDAVFE